MHGRGLLVWDVSNRLCDFGIFYLGWVLIYS